MPQAPRICKKLMDDGVLVREATPALYLYRQRMGDHVQTGLVAGASVDEYEADLIKKHEHTRPVKEDDRTRHIDTLNANTGPVFLTYKAQSGRRPARRAADCRRSDLRLHRSGRNPACRVGHR